MLINRRIESVSEFAANPVLALPAQMADQHFKPRNADVQRVAFIEAGPPIDTEAGFRYIMQRYPCPRPHALTYLARQRNI